MKLRLEVLLYCGRSCGVADDRDRRKGSSAGYLDGAKRDTEARSERPAIKNVDADDSDVEVPSDSDER